MLFSRASSLHVSATYQCTCPSVSKPSASYVRLDSLRGRECCRDAALDVEALQEKGGNIIIGTPGRVADVMKRSSCMDTKQFEVLVLDEADRLLEMGFRTQLDYIMSRLPKQRRTGAMLAPFTDSTASFCIMHVPHQLHLKLKVLHIYCKKGWLAESTSEK